MAGKKCSRLPGLPAAREGCIWAVCPQEKRGLQAACVLGFDSPVLSSMLGAACHQAMCGCRPPGAARRGFLTHESGEAISESDPHPGPQGHAAASRRLPVRRQASATGDTTVLGLGHPHGHFRSEASRSGDSGFGPTRVASHCLGTRFRRSEGCLLLARLEPARCRPRLDDRPSSREVEADSRALETGQELVG